jgi:hypothetical protein
MTLYTYVNSIQNDCRRTLFLSIAVSIIFFERVKSYPTIYLIETEITNRQLVTCRIKK